MKIFLVTVASPGDYSLDVDLKIDAFADTPNGRSAARDAFLKHVEQVSGGIHWYEELPGEIDSYLAATLKGYENEVYGIILGEQCIQIEAIEVQDPQ